MITDGPWEVRKGSHTSKRDVVKVMIDGELPPRGG